MKLNIGDGGIDHDGYEGIDVARGSLAESLPYPDGSVDEVRASHILEHFAKAEVLPVLREWVRVLRPGGVLKVAVPDFRVISEQYLSGAELPIGGYIMGGQVDDRDFHKAIFDYESLSDAFRAVGLVNPRSWSDDLGDTSDLPISLNLAATKPPLQWPKVAAVLSIPRLGFNDFWACAYQNLSPIPLRSVTGAYWDRDLTLAITESLEAHDPEWILTADYDTVFTRDHVVALMDLAMRYPHADAIAPVQTARHHDQPLFTVRGDDGAIVQGLQRKDLESGELLRSECAHFGLTLLRASKLKEMPKPWFERVFNPDRDPDVEFWHKWKAQGNTLYTALRVPVGHCELMVRWPDRNLEAMFQRPGEFKQNGIPEGVWR